MRSASFAFLAGLVGLASANGPQGYGPPSYGGSWPVKNTTSLASTSSSVAPPTYPVGPSTVTDTLITYTTTTVRLGDNDFI